MSLRVAIIKQKSFFRDYMKCFFGCVDPVDTCFDSKTKKKWGGLTDTSAKKDLMVTSL